MIKKIFCLIIILNIANFSFAQTKTIAKDSVNIYTKIEDYAKQSSFRRFVHRLLFRKTKYVLNSSDQNTKKIEERNNKIYEGKIIRNINITTLDPFGYSISDTLEKPERGIEKFGNALHVKTKNIAVKNLILIKPNDVYDSLKVYESERLIRSQRFVRRVLLTPKETKNKDSVDIDIRVLDSWSLIPTGSISSSRGNFEITERNFFGLGHRAAYDFNTRFNDNAKGYNALYNINNFKNTFISATVLYEDNIDNFLRRYISVQRPFYSTFAKWAGGVHIENNSFPISIEDFSTSTTLNSFIRRENFDYWAGYAFPLFKDNITDYRTTNIVISARYFKENYISAPLTTLDSEQFFSNQNLYLASIGLNTRKYEKDYYIFNFNIPEDIPYGKVISFTLGRQNIRNIYRNYYGFRFAYGTYFKYGYISTSADWGSFYYNTKSQQQTLRLDTHYFSPIFHLGNWKVRQFIRPTIVFGKNRLESVFDKVTITEKDGLEGFNNQRFLGTKKATISFQTQTYVPGNWYGFHFSPFFNITLGMLANENEKLLNQQLLTKIGIGVLINNDYLIFNRFQLSLAYFPSIPFDGSNIIKTNTFKNNDLDFLDYQIGKPYIVPFE